MLGITQRFMCSTQLQKMIAGEARHETVQKRPSGMLMTTQSTTAETTRRMPHVNNCPH
jgi:hypothetical protein